MFLRSYRLIALLATGLAMQAMQAQPVPDSTLLTNTLPAAQPLLTHPAQALPHADSAAHLTNRPQTAPQHLTVREAAWATGAVAAITVVVLLLFNVRSR